MKKPEYTVIKNKAEVLPMTPELLAEAFWNMDSEKQADFFTALAELTKNESYPYAQMQWFWMAENLKARGGDSLAMYRSFSVFAFDYLEPCA